MKYFGDGLSEKHRELSGLIRRKDGFAPAAELLLELHAALHLSEVSGGGVNEADLLFRDLSPAEYAFMPSPKDETVAWAVWHIARIEDLTINMLAAGLEQVFNAERKERINAFCSDTGNSMTGDEIIRFSNEIRFEELLAYRNAVGMRTREIIKGLSAGDMKRKITPEGINKIRSEGGVASGSEWLLEYWGKKDVAGILLMPATRHLMLHLNDCSKYKYKIRTVKREVKT